MLKPNKSLETAVSEFLHFFPCLELVRNMWLLGRNRCNEWCKIGPVSISEEV